MQPVDPVELWDTDPFKPLLKDGKFWGRGVDDDKGGLLNAVEVTSSEVTHPTQSYPCALFFHGSKVQTLMP